MNKQLTKEMILAQVHKDEYTQMGRKTTICLLTTKNGFEVVGTSACVNPDTFDAELGRKYAFEDALDRVWELEGYRQQSRFMGVNSDSEKDEKMIDLRA